MEFLADKLLALLSVFSDKRKEDRDLADEAIRAVNNALNDTLLYYEKIDHGENRNPDSEAQLVKAWSKAAIPLRHIDRGFAMACEYKAEYWLDPKSWSSFKIKEKNIGLYDVRDRYRDLIKDK